MFNQCSRQPSTFVWKKQNNTKKHKTTSGVSGNQAAQASQTIPLGQQKHQGNQGQTATAYISLLSLDPFCTMATHRDTLRISYNYYHKPRTEKNIILLCGIFFQGQQHSSQNLFIHRLLYASVFRLGCGGFESKIAYVLPIV